MGQCQKKDSTKNSMFLTNRSQVGEKQGRYLIRHSGWCMKVLIKRPVWRFDHHLQVRLQIAVCKYQLKSLHSSKHVKEEILLPSVYRCFEISHTGPKAFNVIVRVKPLRHRWNCLLLMKTGGSFLLKVVAML